MMVQKAALLRLLVLFLGLSYIVSTAATPTTRSLKSNKLGPPAEDLPIQGAMDFKHGEELFDVGEGFAGAKIGFETADYEGPRANNGHTPPGKP
ncbi:hypothetical protein CJ030_MR2G022057 [Morella rubra]|uniref:Uncharacterized protein n=1 Tax=Morella rubra TaxID=262757 RepID=A0A6A1WKT8_9ROSI|nr:hypothetical protein CJ030_MR2G022057 [Morella rubra]